MKNLTAFLYVKEDDSFGYVIVYNPTCFGEVEKGIEDMVELHSVSIVFGLGWEIFSVLTGCPRINYLMYIL